MYDIVETIENTGYLFQKSAACTGCVDANGNEIYVDSKIYLSGTNHLYEVEFAGGTKYWIFNEDVPKSDLAACSHLFEVAPTDYLQFDD
jgi:outer membrane protein assembly factor BamB